MSTDELLHAIAYLTALDQYPIAEAHAEQIPDWLDILDVLRAEDGIQQLARALDAKRRRTAPVPVPLQGATPIGTDPTAA